MPRAGRVERAGLVVRLDYASLEAARASAAVHEAEVTDQEFGEDVHLMMMVPVSNREALVRALLDATRGRVTILEAPGTK